MRKAKRRPKIRCAIYTRKSSEEGLEQAFNSLDAQREACAAYITSQASEGWKAVAERYDDGGISGGTMDRPALQRLLEDVKRGRVDVIVVYKIDRLTRSLPDFARMVEVFDAHDVSFVSVTQAFNTTNSMGRLTLNVLLSFAQFEREVTGERIRDKIAASKAKGMWMGGTVPLGYDLPSDGARTLVINEEEAEQVRTIFRVYLELGSAYALQQWLHSQGIRSKVRIRKDGKHVGGHDFSRGALRHLLHNPIYIGRIQHKGVLHEGLHEAIVDRELFDAVQARMASQSQRNKARQFGTPRSRHALTGRIFDAEGKRMSPSFSCKPGGRRYLYYVSSPLQRGERSRQDGSLQRVPAAVLEQILASRLRTIDGIDQSQPLDVIQEITVHRNRVEISLPRAMKQVVRASLAPDEDCIDQPPRNDAILFTMPATILRRGGATVITVSSTPGPKPDPILIHALRRAHAMLQRDTKGRPLLKASPDSPYRRKLIRLAFLAPSIQAAILHGQQPASLTLAKLMATDIPLDWAEQTRQFGIPVCRT